MFYMYAFEILRARKNWTSRARKKFCACARHAHLFARPRNSKFPARARKLRARYRARVARASSPLCQKLVVFAEIPFKYLGPYAF